MSSILGFVGNTPHKVHLGQLRRALQLIEYRGLDDQGILAFDEVTGPSQVILDASPGPSNLTNYLRDTATAMLTCHCLSEHNFSSPADQFKTHRRMFVAFDGILDKEADLSEELQRLGRSKRPASQLELLVAALDQWGPHCLSRINGSFALAVLDLHRRTLVLARDAFGTRPLFYTRRNGWGLFFGSNIAAVQEVASLERRVNRRSLYRYLAHNLMEHGADTFFSGIEQVLPGHYLEIPLDKPTQSSLLRYRSAVPVRTRLTFDEAAEHLKELVTRSVAYQVGVRNSVGAAISGGFDSSFVVAAFKRAQLRARLKLYTCVPVVRDGIFSRSEEFWADLVAARFQIPVEAVRVKSEGLPESFASLIRLQEEPFSSPVVYAQLQMFRAARRDGIEIMLSGQGGDTLFAPSTDQLLLAVVAELRRGNLRRVAELIQASRQLSQGSIRELGKAAARTAIPKSLRAFIKPWRRLANPVWLKEKWFELDSTVLEDEPGLPMLRFEDRNSMSCSILNRMPLLTSELKDFVCSLPPEFLIRRDQPMKSIECAAMRGIVPDKILARRERFGFPVPAREWLVELAPWVEMNMAEIERFPFLESRCVRCIWRSVRSLSGPASEAFLVWRWIFFSGWVRHCSVSVE